MAKRLIGTTEIELTDVRTGEVRKITEKNMITGRLQKLLSKNPFGACAPYFIMPVAKRVMGSLALLPERQTEDVNNDILFEDYTAIGPGEGIGDDDGRIGTWSYEESAAVFEGGTGYKYVWNFAESQGNGPIASLSLVNPSIYRSTFNIFEPFKQISGYLPIKDNNGTPPIMYSGNYQELYAAQHYDDKTGNFYHLAPYGTPTSGEYGITVTEYHRPAYIIPIWQTFGVSNIDNGEGILEVNEKITNVKMGSNWSPSLNNEDNLKPIFRDNATYMNSVSFKYEDEILYAYIFSVLNTNTQGTTTSDILVTKINLYEYTVEQNRLSISGGTIRFSTNSYIKDDIYTRTKDYIVKDYFPMVKGYVYVYSGEDYKQIYKVNINDATDITVLTAEENLNINSISGLVLENDYGFSYFAIPQTIQDGVDETAYTFEITNDIIKQGSVLGWGGLEDYSGIRAVIPIDDTYGIVEQLLTDNEGYSFRTHTIVYFTRYKATINNLSTPTSKTINEKMKITYIIRETETT